ncbi:MAG: hypothetical protein PHE56_08880 [Bacteroidales bacterium]|jgi:hypothetical protein|nr:hypothetical protein [Bacteroidales bacterium]
MYAIRDGIIHDNSQSTGIKAYYTKQEIFDAYGWNRQTGRIRLNEIAHKIYTQNPDGTWNNKKKIFSPVEVCHIWNYYGLP